MTITTLQQRVFGILLNAQRIAAMAEAVTE